MYDAGVWTRPTARAGQFQQTQGREFSTCLSYLAARLAAGEELDRLRLWWVKGSQLRRDSFVFDNRSWCAVNSDFIADLVACRIVWHEAIG